MGKNRSKAPTRSRLRTAARAFAYGAAGLIAAGAAYMGVVYLIERQSEGLELGVDKKPWIKLYRDLPADDPTKLAIQAAMAGNKPPPGTVIPDFMVELPGGERIGGNTRPRETGSWRSLWQSTSGVLRKSAEQAAEESSEVHAKLLNEIADVVDEMMGKAAKPTDIAKGKGKKN